MASTNNTPGEALWTRGYPTEDHQIRSGKCKGERKEEDEHKYIPQVNKFRRIYSVGPVSFLNSAQFAILVQRFSNVPLDNLK